MEPIKLLKPLVESIKKLKPLMEPIKMVYVAIFCLNIDF
jgi:hypothetical protein